MSVTVDYARCYHQGVRVPDLDAAMDELGAGLVAGRGASRRSGNRRSGCPTSAPRRCRCASPTRRRVRSTSSCCKERPARCGTAREQPGLHHVGVWSDDVAGETEAAASTPVGRCASPSADPAEGYGVFTYVQPPSGLLVELVSSGGPADVRALVRRRRARLMSTILAHLRVKPGEEARFEGIARELYAGSQASDRGLRHYEYWRGAEPGTYYCLLAYDDHRSFVAHQTSDHHESASPLLRDGARRPSPRVGSTRSPAPPRSRRPRRRTRPRTPTS